MSLRLPTLHGKLTACNNGKCNHGKGTHPTLLGKNEDHSFKTSAKKTYPTRMCAAIATAMTDAIVTATYEGDPWDLDPSPSDPSCLREFHIPWDPGD
eukprot:5643121-Pyramimonas_sp.AAC.1